MTEQQGDLEQAALIFERARELEGDARRAYLDEACKENAALRAEILSMLEAETGQGEFLSDPTLSISRPLSEGPGSVIGHYKLLQLIGQGGFGAVYMAEQKEPVRRKVALKVIKIGMDTRQVVARFEVERQALALMDHPNIARVLDAGATETGRPYFVMELVKGVPIVEYCDTENLSTKDRLELFTQVCNAVQHAHQKGIIHRDIKPSNVMVTLHDGKPVPKVIDFGIAKATDRELTDKTLFTEYRQFIGTPEYMSPEQAEMSGLDIDTRCDIYSLGVLLYELLTGTTPFDAKRLRSMAINELQRVIREEDPPRPSTRLSTLCKDQAEPRSDRQQTPGEASKSSVTAKDVARHRHTDVQSLTRQLRGDLDWIVLRCLEKDRTRRYATANELSADIRCHLCDEPVVASPPGATYRFRKLVRRNKGAFAAGTAIAVALVLGLTASTVGFVSAKRAQLRTAEEAERTRAVADFFKEMFGSVDPGQGGQSPVPITELKVEDLLSTAEPRIADSFRDEPLLEADVRQTFARSYGALGRFDLAEAQSRRVLAIRTRVQGEDHPDTLETTRRLAWAIWVDGGSEEESEAIALLRLAVESGERALGKDDPSVIRSRTYLARILWFSGELEEAERIATDNYERARRILDDEEPGLIGAEQLYGSLLASRGRLKEAETVLRDTLRLARRSHAPDTTATLYPALRLATCLGDRGRYDEALEVATEMAAGYERAYGPDHPWIEHVRGVHCWLLAERGDLAEAAKMREEILAKQRVLLGADHGFTMLTEWATLPLLIDLGRLEEAEEIARRHWDAVESGTQRQAFGGREHFQSLLGWTLLERGAHEEAEPLLRKALAEHERRVPGGSLSTPDYRFLYGRCLSEMERFEEAEPLLLAAYEGERSMRGADHKYTKRCADSLADLYERWGKPGQIEEWRVAGSAVAPNAP